MWASFHDDPCRTIVSCYSPSNSSDETDIPTFYNERSSLVQHISKHNVLLIGGDMNTDIVKDLNNKFFLHILPNINGEYLENFSLEEKLACWNTTFRRKKGKEKLWTYIYPNNFETQLDYIYIARSE